MARRVIRDNSQVQTVTTFGLDPMSAQLATSMALATNTLSPMSSGDGSKFGGLTGQGVNKFSGALPYPVQNFRGAVIRIAMPNLAATGVGAVTGAAAQLPATHLFAWTG